MKPNYVIPFPDFWDKEITTFTEDGIVFTSDLLDETKIQERGTGTNQGNRQENDSVKKGQTGE